MSTLTKFILSMQKDWGYVDLHTDQIYLDFEFISQPLTVQGSRKRLKVEGAEYQIPSICGGTLKH